MDQTSRETYTEDGMLSCLDYGYTQVGRLKGKLEILPRVDENGHSECPFAETLYAEKEEEEKGFCTRLQAGWARLP